ncbi:MAG: hypothetical protein HYX47_19800 [Burkholderiales bacterium]|nr:hypothetical protein [Burkholderiales bacterium]
MAPLRLVLAAALALFMHAAAAQAPAAGETDPDTFFKGRMGGTFGKNIIEVMPSARRVAVAAFRVAFVTDNSVSAQVRGSYLPGRDTSGASSSLYVALKGVDPRTMQAIADKAYADLLVQLAASGREVVPQSEMSEFFASVNATPSDAARPYSKAHNGQTASFFSPTGMPLLFTHFDGGWGDRGAFDLNNYRRLEEYSFKWKAAVIAPLLVVNFARMSTSGNQSGLMSRTAETGAELSMSVAALQSLYSRADEFRNGMAMGGDGGGFSLAVPIASPLPFGTMEKTAQENNTAVKGIFDVLGKAAGLANAGGSARSSSRYVAETSDTAYAAAAQDALHRMSTTLAGWFKKYPPAN